MASLEATSEQLRGHPAARGSLDDAAGFEAIIRRSLPATDDERLVQAVFRWLATRNREAFIQYMFSAQLPSGLIIDARIAELSLRMKNSLTPGPNGYRVGPPRQSAGQRPRSEGRQPRRANEPRRGRNRRRRDRRNAGAGNRGNSGLAVLSESSRRELESRLASQPAGALELSAVQPPVVIEGAASAVDSSMPVEQDPGTSGHGEQIAEALPDTLTAGHWADM